jgi:hypothetical protein
MMEREILLASPALGPQIQYNRSRLRIYRAWLLNSLFITIAFCAWNLRVGIVTLGPAIALVIAGVIFCLGTTWAARTLSRDHYNNLSESYKFLKTRNRKEQGVCLSDQV